MSQKSVFIAVVLFVFVGVAVCGVAFDTEREDRPGAAGKPEAQPEETPPANQRPFCSISCCLRVAARTNTPKNDDKT